MGQRAARERAKFADYDDLKAKAAKLDEFEQANKSEQERLADELSVAKQAAEAAKAEALRFKVASKHGISDEDAELFLTGSDEDTLSRQAQRLTDRVDQRNKSGNHVPNEGTNPQPEGDEVRTFTRGLFGKDG